MKEVLLAVLAAVRAGLRSRAGLQLEILALRHQLAVYQRRDVRAHTKVADRLCLAKIAFCLELLTFLARAGSLAGLHDSNSLGDHRCSVLGVPVAGRPHDRVRSSPRR